MEKEISQPTVMDKIQNCVIKPGFSYSLNCKQYLQSLRQENYQTKNSPHIKDNCFIQGRKGLKLCR